MASSELEKRPAGVDPQDEPSAEWGWYGTFPKATRMSSSVSRPPSTSPR